MWAQVITGKHRMYPSTLPWNLLVCGTCCLPRILTPTPVPTTEPVLGHPHVFASVKLSLPTMEDGEVWLLPPVGHGQEFNRDTQDLITEAHWAVWTWPGPLSLISPTHTTHTHKYYIHTPYTHQPHSPMTTPNIHIHIYVHTLPPHSHTAVFTPHPHIDNTHTIHTHTNYTLTPYPPTHTHTHTNHLKSKAAVKGWGWEEFLVCLSVLLCYGMDPKPPMC